MAKGGSFQNEIAKRLSLWWTDGERDDVFRSTQGSGSRFTVRKRGGKDTAYQGADMTFSDPVGEPLIKLFSIECKSGYSEKSSKKVSKAQEDIVQMLKAIISASPYDDPGVDKLLGQHTHNWCALDLLDSTKTKSLPTLMEMWTQCETDAVASGRHPMLIFRRLGKKPCIALNAPIINRLLEFNGALRFGVTQQVRLLPQNIVITSLADFEEWASPSSITSFTSRLKR